MSLLAALLLLAVQLPHRVVTLDNGLTLVMQPDPSMPVVGVEVWIRGGSREEAPGQHGVAHLFEHNLPASGAPRPAAIRASGAGTQPDFLRFYLHSTPEGLDAVLGMLADRVDAKPAEFTGEAVKRDQDIVVSELRRSMGSEWDIDLLTHLHRGTFGADHPYGHAVSGSESDVRAATTETMRDWHRRFAGASNTVVFLVGNFDPAEGERLVRQHFGSIAPGLRVPVLRADVPRAKKHREVLEMPGQRETTWMRWPVPGWGTPDADLLTLFARILGDEATVETWELAGAFTWRGSEGELQHRLRDGITGRELARAKAQLRTGFVRMLQRPVWRGSRADVLGFGLMWSGDAEHYRTQLARIDAATAANVMKAARRWLGVPGYVLEVVPSHAKVPVIKVERAALPLAQLTVAFDAGTDVEKMHAVVADKLADLGTQVTTGTDPDFSTISVSVLAAHAQEAADILASLEGGEPRVFIASGDVRDVLVERWASAHRPIETTRRPEARRSTGTFEIVDSPSATQATILLSQDLAPSVAKDPLPAQFVVSYMLRSRLMDNLRSAKGWSYEIYPFALELRRGGAMARFNIPVQTDKVAESIAEIRKEIARLRNEPVTNEELARVRGWLEGELTAGLMSLEKMNAQLLELARNDLPPDYSTTAVARLQKFTPAGVQAIARELLRPDHLEWTITGPREAIEWELRELNSAQ